jgi:hypothetical protein
MQVVMAELAALPAEGAEALLLYTAPAIAARVAAAAADVASLEIPEMLVILVMQRPLQQLTIVSRSLAGQATQ